MPRRESTRQLTDVHKLLSQNKGSLFILPPVYCKQYRQPRINTQSKFCVTIIAKIRGSVNSNRKKKTDSVTNQ